MRIHDILMQLPDEYHVMDDVMLKTTNGTTQIDHIVVSKYGVFAIETKNYRGEIYGNDNIQEWKQIIVTKVTYPKKPWKTYTYVTKNQFYNPVKQVVGHMYRIKENLKEWPYLKVIPIVVFTGNADISRVSSAGHVIYDTALLSTIQAYQTSYITDTDIKVVVERLSSKNIRERSKVQNRFKNFIRYMPTVWRYACTANWEIRKFLRLFQLSSMQVYYSVRLSRVVSSA